MHELSRQARCWALHGEYKKDKRHRCRWTDRGHRRVKHPASVDHWPKSLPAAELPDHDEERDMGLAKVSQDRGHAPMLHPDAHQPVRILAVVNEPGNVRIFRQVYEEQSGEEAPLADFSGGKLGNPMPYLNAGVLFLYGEQRTLCMPTFSLFFFLFFLLFFLLSGLHLSLHCDVVGWAGAPGDTCVLAAGVIHAFDNPPGTAMPSSSSPSPPKKTEKTEKREKKKTRGGQRLDERPWVCRQDGTGRQLSRRSAPAVRAQQRGVVVRPDAAAEAAGGAGQDRTPAW